MKDNRKILKYVSVILLIVAVLFIWGNSMKPGEESLEDSGAVKAFVDGIFEALGMDAEIGELFIRKLGHFAEYFLLGLIACFAVWQHSFPKKPYVSAAFCAVIAAIDETIQLFVDGRNGNILDVLLDSFGAICAILLVLLILFIKKEKISKNT